MASTFVLINSTTVASSGISTITFSSIPNTYKDLVIFASCRNSLSSRFDANLTFNSVTSSYRQLYAEGYSTNVTYSSFANAAANYQPIYSNESGMTANYFACQQVYICNYNSTANKPILSYGADTNDSTSTFYIGVATGAFVGAAVTSLSLKVNTGGGDFAQQSTFHLYGISYS